MGLRKKLSWHSRKNKCPSFLHFCCDASSFNSFSLNLIPPSIDNCQSSYVLMCNLYISAGISWKKSFKTIYVTYSAHSLAVSVIVNVFMMLDKLIWQPIQCFNVSMLLVSGRAKCRNVNWCERCDNLWGVNKNCQPADVNVRNLMQNSKNINKFLFLYFIKYRYLQL